MMDIHTQRELREEELAGLDRFLFLIQNRHFRHLKEYLNEKTFKPVAFRLPARGHNATVIFITAPLPAEFIEEVIRPWVEKWHCQHRGNKLEEVPQIIYDSTAMTIFIPLTSVEIAVTQLKME